MAFPHPASRGNRMVEPPPGNRPCVFSSWPNRTSALATRMSATRCSSWAMFQVSPWTTAIRGLVRCWVLLGLLDLADVVDDRLRHARVEFHHALRDSADVAQHPVLAGPCARQETRARDGLMQCLRREVRMEVVVAVENKRRRCHGAEF